jgi:hypothetical protein
VNRRGRTRLTLTPAVLFAASVASLGSACAAITLNDLVTPRPVPGDTCVVVGFLGGRVRWNDANEGVRRLALRLRSSSSSIAAETFENRRRSVAERFVTEALDRDSSGRLSFAEASGRKLVVYGQSFGGAAVVKFAESLARRSVPVEVLLTIQLDSVGRGDGVVPDNVRYALNLYQSDGLIIVGEHPIRAQNPATTAVLGNWSFSYREPPGSMIALSAVPWWKLLFRVAHARMDRDPRVWARVESMIRGACSGEDLEALAARLAPIQ